MSCWFTLVTLKADLRPYENKSESLPEFMLTFTWSPFDILISFCESTSICTSAQVLLKSKNLLTFFVYPCSMFDILWSTCTLYSTDSNAHECYKSINFIITVYWILFPSLSSEFLVDWFLNWTCLTER